MANCPVCDAKIEASETLEKGELLLCSECDSELEVKNISPLELQEAPMEEEDWGQ